MAAFQAVQHLSGYLRTVSKFSKSLSPIMGVFNPLTLEYEGSDVPDGHESTASSSPSCLRLSHHRPKRYTRSSAKPRGTITDLKFTKPPSNSSNSAPGLMSLPSEILAQIIEYVQHNSGSEASEIHKRRFGRLSRTVNGDMGTTYFSCVHKKKPILNSLEAVSVTNQRMYALCRPLLWKVSNSIQRNFIELEFMSFGLLTCDWTVIFADVAISQRIACPYRRVDWAPRDPE